MRSKLEFKIREQEIANKAIGWKPAISGSGQASPACLVLSAFFLGWYLGVPVLFFAVWWPQTVEMMAGMKSYIAYNTWSEMMSRLPTMAFIAVVLWLFGAPILIRMIQACYKAAK
jgi:hypothetical protein